MKNKPTVMMDMPEMKNTLHLCECELPEIKDWEVGKEYEITLKVKQTGTRISEGSGKEKEEVHADFDILAVSVAGEEPKEPVEAEDSDYEEESTEEVDDKKEEEVEGSLKPKVKVAEALRRKFSK